MTDHRKKIWFEIHTRIIARLQERPNRGPLWSLIDDMQKVALEYVLEECGQNSAAAGRILGIEPSTMSMLRKRLGLPIGKRKVKS